MEYYYYIISLIFNCCVIVYSVCYSNIIKKYIIDIELTYQTTHCQQQVDSNNRFIYVNKLEIWKLY